MNTGHGRRAVVIVAAALAAAVAASPAAGSAQSGTASSTAWAGCNAFLRDASAGLGGLDGIQAAMRGAARGRTEKVMDASDIEIPAGEVPKVPKRFSVVIPTHFHVINGRPDGRRRQHHGRAGPGPDARAQRELRGDGLPFSLASVDRTTNAEWYAMASRAWSATPRTRCTAATTPI